MNLSTERMFGAIPHANLRAQTSVLLKLLYQSAIDSIPKNQ